MGTKKPFKSNMNIHYRLLFENVIGFFSRQVNQTATAFFKNYIILFDEVTFDL